MNHLLQMGLRGSILILVLAVVRYLAAEHIPKRIFVFLWFGVVLRLLLPFSVPVSVNIWNLDISGKKVISQESQTEISYEFQTNTVLETDKESEKIVLFPKNNKSRAKTMTVICRAVWLLVMGVMFFSILFNHFKSLRMYKTSLPAKGEMIEKWIKEHSGIRKLEIRKSDQIGGPLTYGLFCPVILLPARSYLKERELLYVLEHEWIHIKRWDILLKYFLCLVLCVYWFNPFVWLMAILLNRDIELACDEEVLKGYTRSQKEEYAFLLLRLLERPEKICRLNAFFTKNSKIEERIYYIMKTKKYTWKTIILTSALVLTTAWSFTSQAKGQSEIGGNSINSSMAVTMAKKPVKKDIKSNKTANKIVTGEQIAALAEENLGAPYEYGGTDLKKGVDSSGFVKVIYDKKGIELPRTLKQMSEEGKLVTMKEAAPGDLVFYGEKNGNKKEITHVAIYAGNNKVIHAKNNKVGVVKESINYRKSSFIRRIIN